MQKSMFSRCWLLCESCSGRKRQTDQLATQDVDQVITQNVDLLTTQDVD